MSVSKLHKAAWGFLALAALCLPNDAHAQVREVVSKEVAVGRSEATLRLEFADLERLEIRFSGGQVVVDGEVLGSYQPGGDLDAAWRALLGEAVALDDGPLSEMLADWTVPAELAGDPAGVAHEIDDALERALRETEPSVGDRVSVSVEDPGSLVETLLGSVSRLGLIEEALAGLDQAIMVHVGEDVVVPAGTVTEGTLVVIEGTVRIEGEVEGDVVVVSGALDLRDGGRVDGEVRLADARILRNEGSVRGGLVDVREDERAFESALRDSLRGEIEREVRDNLRNELRQLGRGEDDGLSIMAPFRPVARAVGGIFEKLVTILFLALLGAAALAFAGDNLDVIAETARRSPRRSAMVGFAGTILLLPVWILGAVALAVSIIFIPVAIAWLPLFPLAACLAALVGYLAVARNAGEWLADSNYPWTGWIRKSNGLIAMVGGLVGLMSAFIAAHVLSVAPVLRLFSGLLVFAGTVITIVAIQVGFGAVLLTRAGRRREQWSAYDPDAAWEAAMSSDVDIDDAMDPSPRQGGGSRPSRESDTEAGESKEGGDDA